MLASKQKISNAVKIKIFIFSLLAMSLVFFAGGKIVSGNIDNASVSSPSATPTVSPLKAQIRQTTQNAANAARTLKAEEAQKIKNLKDQNRLEIENRVQALKTNITAAREGARERIEAYREKMKEKLAQFKDERKKKIAERVDQQLEKLNTGMTNHFINVLDRLEKIINNISSRTDKAEAAGHDVAAVKTAIVRAQTAISSARQTVQSQAGKVYEITLTTEDKLKVDVGQARQALHKDLTAARQKVKDARDAAHQAAAALAQIAGVDDIEIEPTNSVSPSPSVVPSGQ